MNRALLAGGAGLLCSAVAAVATPAYQLDIARVKTLNCGAINGFHASHSSGLRVLLGRVALPTQGWFRSWHLRPQYDPPLPYYAKAGLEVRAHTAPFDLVVPAAWRSRLALGWDEDHRPRYASVIRVPECPPVLGRAWVAWAGGYFLRMPACVPIIVRSESRSVRIRLAIGRACP